jgi:hypothetical protein
MSKVIITFDRLYDQKRWRAVRAFEKPPAGERSVCRVMHRLIVALLGAISLSACRPDGRDLGDSTRARDTAALGVGANSSTTPPDGARLSVRLVNSLPYTNELDNGILHYLEIRRGKSVDTIRQIRTNLRPVISGDTAIYGFLYDSLGTMTHVFSYRVASEILDSLPLPPDFQPGVSIPSLAPDAHHVAYVVFDSTARGVVRRWPDLAMVLETPTVQHMYGDALTGVAGWSDARTFEIHIVPNAVPMRWVRFRGSLDTQRFAVDTVPLQTQP